MEAYLGESIPKLGFGLMRLPRKDGVIDIEQVSKMVDAYLDAGFCYFDTAYVYEGSEEAARKALVERHPRESYLLADKFPIWDVNEPEDVEKLFNTSLERTGAGYFDFYLLHCLNKNRPELCEQYGVWDFILRKKAEGLIRHIGFSFHDTAEVLDRILTAHPETEFVQLQINYADWENEKVQSRLCYEVARKHGKPVVVMEPVKGGTLASMMPEAEAVFKAVHPELSVASWAVRYAASLDGVVTVLSGMSTPEQMEDNLSYMKNFRPLDEEERRTVQIVWNLLQAAQAVPCTGCNYCREVCPQQIAIPGIFEACNYYAMYRDEETARDMYANRTNKPDRLPASACIQCGQCEALCPQHILIREALEKARTQFENGK